ncbi:MAG: alanine--tRNA ligase-related protein, partial [Oscillospiraceae bacterium]|nr:alanine--tRNA ligase-related protein [Oscillospiraceae bacterium]
AKKILLGADAFKLSDTFGFPLDLTKEILGERGMTVDEEEFNRLIQKQKDTARKARKDAGADAWKDSGAALNDLNATVFTGYNELETDCAILAVMANGKKSDFLNSGEEAALILDKTPFYAESGGQTGDDGLISGGGFTFEVEDTTKTGNGVVLHIGRIIEGESLTAGEKAKASVDKGSRSAVMRNHTAAHLLQAALRKILGSHVEQAGQLVTKDSVRFDFTHFSALTSEEIMKVENEVNRDILEGVPVLTEEMGIDEAKAIGAMALFGEKYGDMVRVVRAGDFSAELCGGTHLDNTAKAGLFKILSETSVAAGVRRIEGVTGFGVLDLINSRNELIYKTVEKLKTGNISQLFERAAAVMAELKEKDREIESLKGEIAGSKAGEILQKAKDLNGFKVIIENMGETAPDTLRSLADTIKAAGDEYIAVLAGVTGGKVNFACCAGKKAVEAGVHAGNIVRETAKIAGGGGGGRPDSATAGGKDPSKLDEALDVALKIIEKTILNS